MPCSEIKELEAISKRFADGRLLSNPTEFERRFGSVLGYRTAHARLLSHTDASAELRHLPALNAPERLASGRHHGGGAREDYTSAVVSTSHQAGSPVIDVAKSASWPPTRLTTDSVTHTRSARKKPQDPCHKRHSSVFVISDSNHEYDAQGDNCKVGCYEKRMGDSSPEKGAE
jgi:hypothetical protein